MPDITAGKKTSEFKLSVATALISSAIGVCSVFGLGVPAWFRPDAPWVAIAVVVVNALLAAVYAVSRAGLKRPHNLADLVADAEALEPALVALIGDAKTVAERLKPAKKAAPVKSAAPPAS